MSIPMASLDGLPLGLSLVARRGGDLMLLSLARRLMDESLKTAWQVNRGASRIGLRLKPREESMPETRDTIEFVLSLATTLYLRQRGGHLPVQVGQA